MPTSRSPARHDVVVVGAGFAGLYLVHRLRASGLSVRVFEAGGDVGGTWYWNRYPGARCDVESMQYSYQFSHALEQDWNWTERYAAQPEILAYARHVEARFDLRRDITFEAPVRAAHYLPARREWRLEVDGVGTVAARFVVMATGCLSVPNVPDIAGLGDFRGRVLHTGRWPHAPVDLGGAAVGVIGTGSSAIQAIPLIARAARHLTVFQRTPNYAIPAHNRPLGADEQARVKAGYSALRERARRTRNGIDHHPNDAPAALASAAERRREFEARWAEGGLGFLGAFSDLMVDPEANESAAAFVRERIRARVRDPALAEALSPTSTFGCKRLCVDIDYYETFNRPDVTLVDLRRQPIERVTADGVRTTAGSHRLDTLVLATGFDAMTGALTRIDIRGRDGTGLAEKWAAGPRSYLGLGVSGFPNLFIVTGPGSPSVLSNMIPSIELHADWIARCIERLRDSGHDTIEPEAQAEDAWVEHVNELAGRTLFTACNSWYVGANVPGKARVFMPYLGTPAYERRCRAVETGGYAGFRIT